MKNKKKKVAFCFSGQARTLDLCYPYIKRNFLDPLGKNKKDYDIFCCVEDDKDASKVNILKPTKILKITSRNFNKEYKDVLRLNYRKFFARGNLNNQLNQIYKIYLANNLRKDYQKEKNISYDWVIRTRFDIFPLNKINYSKLSKEYLYIPRAKELRFPNYSDIIALGSDNLLNIYSDRIKEFKDILKTFFSDDLKLSLKTSFFFERGYISFFEFLERLFKKDNLFSKICRRMIIIRGNFFLRPPQENCYTAEYGLFKYLEKKKVHCEVLLLDYALVRKRWEDNCVFLDKQEGTS